ncbi:MAG: RNA methyltransferase, partial [Marinilabiliaceae bacterium]
MLEKAQKKLITSLSQKKYRDSHGFFVAEGPKLIHDLLTSGMAPEILVSVHDESFFPNLTDTSVFYPVDETEFKKISFLK